MIEDESAAAHHEEMMRELLHRDDESMRYILSDSRGRWFFERLIERCEVMQITIPTDLAPLMLHEGRRSIGMYLLNDLKEQEKREGNDKLSELKREAEREYDSFAKRLEDEQNG